MTKTILALNAGSSSVKGALYTTEENNVHEQKRGAIDRVNDEPVLEIGDYREEFTAPMARSSAVAHIAGALCQLSGLGVPDVTVHRIAHGGPSFTAATPLTDEVLAELSGLTPFAPLHQPHAISAARAMMMAYPQAEHLACFDTAFHATMPEIASVLPLPKRLREQGLRRYGFHGLSYEYIAGWLVENHPTLARGRVVVAHLGSGASLCALKNGRSVATTMGLTPLDGLPMATRTGRIDPGVVLHLVGKVGLTPNEVERCLYQESGLMGLSSLSGDLRDLHASDDEDAAMALRYFALRTAEEISGLTVHLKGLEGLVFTGGIGSNDAVMREMILDHLGHLQSFEVLVTRTDESLVMARHASTYLAAG